MTVDTSTHNEGTEEELGLFPLGAVVFPGMLIPLQVFEPRYLSLVKRCLSEGELFVIPLIRSGSEVRDVPFVFETASTVEILEHREIGNGMLHILCRGVARVKISDIASDEDKLMRAKVISCQEVDNEEPYSAQRELMEYALELRESITASEFYRYIEWDLEKAADLAWFLSSMIPLSNEVKQEILEEDSASARLSLISAQLENAGEFQA